MISHELKLLSQIIKKKNNSHVLPLFLAKPQYFCKHSDCEPHDTFTTGRPQLHA